MASIFGDEPTVPQEDPSIRAAREAERRRSEADRITATQEQLRTETLRRRRGFSLFGGFGGKPVSSLLGAG